MVTLSRAVRSCVPLIAIIVAMLAAGSGLPGLVLALSGASAHVCTCAEGGSHASCPVCNPASLHSHRSGRSAVDGAPCGERRFAIDAPADPSTLAASPAISVVGLVARLRIAPSEPRHIEDVRVEPPTPPPRTRLA